MTRTVATILVVLAAAPAARAQFTYAPGVVYGPGFGGGFVYRGGFGFGGPGFHFGGGVVQKGFYAAPVVPYFGWFPIAGPGWSPGVGNPYFLGYPAGLDYPTDPDPSAYSLPFGIPVNPAPQRAPGSLLSKDSRPDDYLVIRPKPEGTPSAPKSPAAKGTIEPKLDRVAPPPDKRKPPLFAFDPFADRRAPGQADVPEADANAEAARQVRQAVQAFGVEKYGQAVEHLDRAIKARPDDAVSHFIKGQAQLAAGQYAEATWSVRDGLKLAPDWPASDFKLKDLYAGKPDRFDADLAALRKAVADNPDEPALRFLLAYELWFGGDRAEARKLFQAVATQVKDATLVERFLKEPERK